LRGAEKKQYVKDLKKEAIDGPVLLVERGYGNSFQFNSVLVQEKGFYAENHLNVIYPKVAGSQMLETLTRVSNSFKDERCLKFIRQFLGNGSISSKDLEGVVPVF